MIFFKWLRQTKSEKLKYFSYISGITIKNALVQFFLYL